MSFDTVSNKILARDLDADGVTVLESYELEIDVDGVVSVDPQQGAGPTVSAGGDVLLQACTRALAKLDSGEIGARTQVGDVPGSEADDYIQHLEETASFEIDATGGKITASVDALRAIEAGIIALGVTPAV